MLGTHRHDLGSDVFPYRPRARSSYWTNYQFSLTTILIFSAIGPDSSVWYLYTANWSQALKFIKAILYAASNCRSAPIYRGSYHALNRTLTWLLEGICGQNNIICTRAQHKEIMCPTEVMLLSLSLHKAKSSKILNILLTVPFAGKCAGALQMHLPPAKRNDTERVVHLAAHSDDSYEFCHWIDCEKKSI